MTVPYDSSNPQAARRITATIEFMKESVAAPATILDIGEPNPLGREMQREGYDVVNTPSNVDLDLKPETVDRYDVEIVTAFEILEHLVSPFPLLNMLPCDRLFATVPLRLWFASAYRNPDDPRDRHYHEFEDWQFDWLLEKAGWTIIRRKKWTNPSKDVGLRPVLRRFTPRHYAVEAIRES